MARKAKPESNGTRISQKHFLLPTETLEWLRAYAPRAGYLNDSELLRVIIRDYRERHGELPVKAA